MKFPAGNGNVNSLRRALACASIFVVGACATAGAQSSVATLTRLDGTTIDATALTERIEALTRAANVHGLTVTIFNDAEKVYSRAFGVASLPANKPLRTATEIYGASLSKAVFSVLVMKLVDQGVLDLDKPLQDYVSAPLCENRGTAWHEDLSDLCSDPRYRRITARMSMSHTTGLPGWRWFEPDQKLRIHFAPGERYSYSGEGMTFLQAVIQKITGKSLEALMQAHVFAPYGMAMSSYTWQPRFEADYAVGHAPNGKAYLKDKDNAARAPSTLETTTDDYAKFMAAVLRRDGLSNASWNEIFKPQVRIHSKTQFGPGASDTTSAYDPIELSYGLGWGLQRTPYGWGAFKEAHGDGFQHYSIVYPAKKLGVLLMSNSDNAESIFGHLLRLTIADTFTPLEWENYVPYDRVAPVASTATIPVGIFDSQADVGRPRHAGSASYHPERQEYLVAGSGQNMWGDRDDFHFVWKRMTGNFILSTRAKFVGKGVDPHRKIGWTIRPSLETNSPHVTAALHGDGLVSLQFRRTTGAITEEAKAADSLPNADAVIQLERRDGVYVMSVARFGDTLVTQDLTGVTLPDTVYVGLFVCAHNDTVVERAAFSNVRITIPAKSDLVVYRDYLGSNLEILDVATGNATIVHRYRGSFQAPNWTADGKALIYAQEGLLQRFDLSSRSASPINTGFATSNNNDHVLSFDGRMMAISHHAVEDSGVSIIYTVPATGGTPRRVTAKGPSYLHGWSPDGRWLVYTGIRGKELDVYKIPVVGGSEIRLTSAPGLDDGPEYTPDGKYIYFNSSRSGRMQIWRMRPDGSAQEQITNDGFNNWFPHISPDGKWIAYIAFPPDVDKDDHPFYKHVMLRLMPVSGGPARVIAYVYGGQGTINVPSWSPDGTRLAFVSNSTIR